MAISLSNVKDVLTLASSVIKLGESLYNARDALDEFKSNVDKLNRTYEYWQRTARRYGLSSERILCESLKEAMEQLRYEEDRLRSLDRGCGCLWLWLSSGTNFPAELGKSVVNLDDAILRNWKAHDKIEDAVRRRAQEAGRSPKFPFKRDSRYVRLPLIEKKVKSILNNKGSADEAVRVVLLYGRAGTGKSCMARSLALDYHEVASSEADGHASNSTNGCREFDDVLYVECGPSADSSAKKEELLRLLLGERSSDRELKSETSKKVELTKKASMKVQTSSVDSGHLMLEQLLKDRRSLIIFDDVWEEMFLKNMVDVCGKHMKILVTSQTVYMCKESLIEDSVAIDIERLSKEESLRILKVHAGFGVEDHIPVDVKKFMDNIVAKLCRHPHALASIAVAIDRRHRSQVRQWEEATHEYDELLDDSLSKRVKNPLQDVPYERSFSEAIEMKLRRVDQDAKKLLILLVMCRGPSIPEEVVRLFYREIIAQDKSRGVTSSRKFSIARRQLENLKCIKVGEYEYTWGDPGLIWSIHSLDQQFIQHRMGNDIEEILGLVQHLSNGIQGLEVEPQVNTIKLLGTLSFKPDLGKQVKASLASDLKDLSKIERLMNHSFAIPILLPIIRLMTENVRGDWDMKSRKSSDQIFLSLTTEAVIHNDAARTLLKSSRGKFPIWAQIRNALYNIRGVWSINEDIVITVLQAFGDLELHMAHSDTEFLNSNQYTALLQLVAYPGSDAPSCILHMGKIVRGLVELLTSPCPRFVRQLTAAVLSYLVPLAGNTPCEYGQEVLARTPMIVEELVHACQEHKNKRLVKGDVSVTGLAVQALRVLARVASFDVKQKMISTGLDHLVDVLRRGGDAQSNVLEILSCLVGPNNCILFDDNGKVIVSRILHLSDCLADCLATGSLKEARSVPDAAELLMMVDPKRAESMILHSSYEPRARGLAWIELRQYDNAVRDLEEALKLDPLDSLALQGLTHTRVQLEDWKGALKDYHDVIEQPGLSPKGCHYKQRGILKSSMGDFSGALEDLDRSLQLNPNDWSSLGNRGWIKRMMRDLPGALEDFSESFRLNQWAGKALEDICLTKFLMDDEEGAKADARELEAKFGNIKADLEWGGVAYQERGVLKRMQGNLCGALEDLNKGLELRPNDYEILKQRGFLRNLMGDKEGAETDAKEALRSRPREADDPGYEYSNFGTSIVEFLDFRL